MRMPIELTFDMMVVLAILAATVLLFITEVFRIDFTAILVMIMLGILSQLPGLDALADPNRLFEGFASNAVISIIAVMIIGAGLDKTGLMSKVASTILKYGGKTEVRIVPIISGTVGVISSFMQNVGAAALFLPVVSRISVRTGLPLSRLLMPMGFCAILGGTITMVGSSPLILLNDLIQTANTRLPADQQMAPFSLFSVMKRRTVAARMARTTIISKVSSIGIRIPPAPSLYAGRRAREREKDAVFSCSPALWRKAGSSCASGH
jgi:di/tricarboxylate transporter